MKRWLCLLLLLVAAAGWGTDYYVDKTAGDDSNDGSSGSPWEYCPGMQGWTGSATLSPADTVYFDSDDTWAYSGSTQNAILTVVGGVTYDGSLSQASGWTDQGGRAKFDRPAAAGEMYHGLITIGADDATYDTVVNRFELDGNGNEITGVRLGWQVGANLTGATKRVSNCVVHDCGIVDGSTFQYGIHVRPEDSSYTISNIEILNNTVYNTSSDLIALYPGGGMATDILVRGNEAYNGGLVSTHESGACLILKNDVDTVTAEFNYFRDSYQGITFETSSGGDEAPRNIIIRYNIVTGVTSIGAILLQSSFTGTMSADFYGNLVFDNGHQGVRITGSLSGTTIAFKFYNNTFYSNCGTGGDEEFEIADTPNMTLELKNNIFYAESANRCVYDTSADITAHNNNIYYRSGGGNLVYSNGTNYTSGTLSSYEGTASASDPTLKNTSNLPAGFTGTYGTDMVPEADGLSTESGPSIGAGADLGDTYRGAINLSGTDGGLTRDDADAWDIGAYQYGAEEAEPPVQPATDIVMILAQIFGFWPELVRSYLVILWNAAGALLVVALGLKWIGRI